MRMVQTMTCINTGCEYHKVKKQVELKEAANTYGVFQLPTFVCRCGHFMNTLSRKMVL